MSYLVLARKWRPQTFEEVVGQTHVTRTLKNAIRAGRVAHAYLFTGPRGVGKTSVARILAKNLNCETGVTVTPCNVCSNCREITQGHSVDVAEIDGASNRGIDNIRELRETVRYRPSKSRHKIYIIDEVHMLTPEAFNALLKTLEEPPDHVRFIFATTEPHKIPATILSRCQRFDFRRIDTRRLLDHLKTIVADEGVALSEPVLYAIAREADGGMRDAQSLLEQLLAFSGEGLTDEEILDVLGVVDRRSVHRAASAVLDGDPLTCFEIVEDIYRRGIDSRRFCQQLSDFFRNLLWLALSRDKAGALSELPESEKELMLERLEGTNVESLYLLLQSLVRGEEEIRRSSSPRLSLEMLLLRLSQLPRIEDLNRVVDELERLERLFSESVAPVRCRAGGLEAVEGPSRPDAPEGGDFEVRLPPPGPAEVDTQAERAGDSDGAEPEPRRPASPEEIVARWPSFLQWVEGREPKLAAKLGGSSVRIAGESVVELEILEVYENLFQSGRNTEVLAALAADYFKVSPEWRVTAKSSSLEGRSERARGKGSPGSDPRRLVLEHPTVQDAVEILGGELIEVRPLEAGKRQGRKGRGSKASE